MLDDDFEQAMILLKDIIELNPDSFEAIKAITILPHVQGGIDGDFLSLIPYLEQISNPNLQEIVNVSIARLKMFAADYYQAVYRFEEVIENSDCVLTQLIAELDQLYCLWQLEESGCRLVPNISRVKSLSSTDYFSRQLTIRTRINEFLKEEKVNSITEPVVSGITSTNFPNPFNPSTMISFDLAKAGNVRIDIFNIRGQRVRTLVNNHYDVGRFRVEWNGTDDNGRSVGSGVYFYTMRTGEFTATKSMLMMK